MANNNAITELQLLEGIYEHLTVVEEISKNMTTLSGRVRKVEERLMEPIEITNPILKVGNHKEISRNDSIYGALVKSCEACHSLDAQKIVIEDIKSGVQKNWNTIGDIMEYQINQKWVIKDINQEILNVKADVLKSKEVADRRFKVVIWLMTVLMIVTISQFFI